jgi:hypothetical protein
VPGGQTGRDNSLAESYSRKSIQYHEKYATVQLSGRQNETNKEERIQIYNVYMNKGEDKLNAGNTGMVT